MPGRAGLPSIHTLSLQAQHNIFNVLHFSVVLLHPLNIDVELAHGNQLHYQMILSKHLYIYIYIYYIYIYIFFFFFFFFLGGGGGGGGGRERGLILGTEYHLQCTHIL